MSASTMIDAFDTPMVDFSDDVDVAMAGSSSDGWFQPQTLAHMEEDTRLPHASEDITLSQIDSLEVDMMTYDETAEYEMGDVAEATATEPGYAEHVQDAEFFDVSLYPSPLPLPADELASQPSDTTTGLVQHELVREGSHFSSTHNDGGSGPADLVGSVDHHAETAASGDPEPVPAVPDDAATLLDTQAEGGESDIAHRLSDAPTAEVGAGTAASDPDPLHLSQQVDSYHTEYAAVEGAEVGAAPTGDGHGFQGEDVRSHEAGVEHEAAEEYHTEESKQPQHDETATREDGATHEEAGHHGAHASLPQPEGTVYFDPPPAIHLTLHITPAEGEQPDFVLFSAPDAANEASTSAATPSDEPLILLQHLPSLYYEPISAVFEAIRHEEYFAHLEELSQAEMALNAFDLQLVISEDNLYAREVSLHDLYAMHLGMGLPGHLRLMLQSVFPRFINRYNQIRDQITHMTLTEGTEEIQEPGDEAAESHEAEETVPEDVLERTEDAGKQDVEEHRSIRDPQQDLASHDSEDGGGGAAPTDAGPLDEADAEEDADGEPDTEAFEDEQALHNPLADESQDGEPETEDQAPYDDEFGDEFGDDDDGTSGDSLDADAIHVHADEEEQDDVGEQEHTTEFTDVVLPQDDDDDSFGEDLEDGAEGTGTAVAEEAAAASANEAEYAPDDELREEVILVPATDVQAPVVSQSVSATTGITEDSNVNSAFGEDGEESTDLNVQHASDTFNDEGNLVEDDEFGDDEDFADQETLEDSAETLDDGVDLDAVGEVDEFATGNEGGADENEKLDDPDKTANDANLDATADEFVIVHKKHSKRSLDDADLEEDGDPAPGSPGSKRSRTN